VSPSESIKDRLDVGLLIMGKLYLGQANTIIRQHAMGVERWRE
jgi:hypothetical protein